MQENERMTNNACTFWHLHHTT